MLQHGSLPLRGDIARICDVLVFAKPSERERARDQVRQRAGTVAAVLGREVGWDQVAGALVRGLARALEVQLQPGKLSPDELQRAGTLRVRKYAQPDWTQGQSSALARVCPPMTSAP